MEHTVSDDSLSEDNSSTSVTLIAGPAGATGQDADGDSPAHADATDATVVAAADLAIMEVKHRQKTSIVSKMNLVLETVNLKLVHRLMQKKSHIGMLKAMPHDLYIFWSETAKHEFPGIQKSAMFFVEAAAGLMDYFECVELAKGERTILTSLAVHSIWRAWVKYDKKFCRRETSLKTFTKRCYCREIEYCSPVEFSLDVGVEEALARTYVLNCILNGFDFIHGVIPSLFRLDGVLKMPHGLRFSRVSAKEGIVHRALDEYGFPSGKFTKHYGLSLIVFHRIGYMNDFPEIEGLDLFAEPRREQMRDVDQIQEGISNRSLRIHSHWKSSRCNYDPYALFDIKPAVLIDTSGRDRIMQHHARRVFPSKVPLQTAGQGNQRSTA